MNAKTALALLLAGCLLQATPAVAGEQVVTLDPAASSVRFTLGATLHTVHGTIPLERGELRLDPDAHSLTGEVVADAARAETGNGSRDKKMHRKVLRTGEHPIAVLRVMGFEGDLAPSGTSRITLRGEMVLLEKAHEVEIPAEVTITGDRVDVHATFEVPYVAWGLEDPSAFLLRVDKTVQVEVEAEGALSDLQPE